jgi:hypothetical protein
MYLWYSPTEHQMPLAHASLLEELIERGHGQALLLQLDLRHLTFQLHHLLGEGTLRLLEDLVEDDVRAHPRAVLHALLLGHGHLSRLGRDLGVDEVVEHLFVPVDVPQVMNALRITQSEVREWWRWCG